MIGTQANTALDVNIDVEMDPETLFTDFRSRIVGREIRSRRLAANSLLVYIDHEPGDALGLTLWFEPTWHPRNHTRVLAGSRQAQHDPEGDDPDAGFRLAAEAVDSLIGERVSDLRAGSVSGDLRLETDHGLTLCTFVSDPSDDHLWHIRDSATRVALYSGAGGLRIVTPDV